MISKDKIILKMSFKTWEETPFNLQCICSQEGVQHSVECVICGNYYSKIMSKWEREEDCKINQLRIFICGRPEYVCLNCARDGWYSTAGCGGGQQHINRKTGVYKHQKID